MMPPSTAPGCSRSCCQPEIFHSPNHCMRSRMLFAFLFKISLPPSSWIFLRDRGPPCTQLRGSTSKTEGDGDQSWLRTMRSPQPNQRCCVRKVCNRGMPSGKHWASVNMSLGHGSRVRSLDKRRKDAPIKGSYKFTDVFPISDGFEENAAYFKLDFLDPGNVTRGEQVESIVPSSGCSPVAVELASCPRGPANGSCPRRTRLQCCLKKTPLAHSCKTRGAA